MTKNAYVGPNEPFFGQKTLIFMGVSKIFGTHMMEDHLGNLSALFFDQAIDQMGQKWPYLAENALRARAGKRHPLLWGTTHEHQEFPKETIEFSLSKKNQTNWPIEIWTLKQEMETDYNNAIIREHTYD